MGNRLSMRTRKCDFVSDLPPELVTEIFSFSTLKDVLRCQLVCRRWKVIILQLYPYWTMLLRQLKLSQRSISDYMRDFSTPKDFFLAVRRYQEEIKASKFVSSLAMYPQYPVADCFVMEKCNVIIKRDNFGGKTSLQVQELVFSGIINTRMLCSVTMHEELSVMWTHYSSSEQCLFWVNNTGLCSGFDISKNKEIDSCDFSLLSSSPGDEKSGGSLVITGCDMCSLVLACQMKAQDSIKCSHIHLQVTRLVGTKGMALIMKTNGVYSRTLEHTSCCTNLRSFHTHSGSNKSMYASLSSPTQYSDGGHLFHYALVWNKGATIYVPLDSLETTFECINCRYRVKGSSNEMTLSSSGSLFGNIYDDNLYVWRVSSSGGLNLLSKTCIIVWDDDTNPDKNQAGFELVALGNHLSIVRELGKDFTVSHGGFYIVLTESGEILKQICNSMPPTVGSSCSSPPDIISYLCTGDTHKWLNEFSASCPFVLFAVAYNRNGKLGFLLVQQSSEKQGRHWVQAINYGFQN